MTGEPQNVVVTGIGLVTSLGDGTRETLDVLASGGAGPRIDVERFAPYPVHPASGVDFSRQISKKSDLRQMETWQKIGVYAAGLALQDGLRARRLDDLSGQELAHVFRSGLGGGLRLHKFKRTMGLPRVRRVLGVLR